MAGDGILSPSDARPAGEFFSAHEPPLDDHLEPIGIFLFALLALAVGIVAGLGAVAFRDLIGFVHNLLFLRHFSIHYDARVFTPSDPWGALVILVPVLGSVAVTFLVSNFAPEAKGHGVPEVMDANYYHRGIIRPVVALVKSVASAIAIGSGAAVGREGPIIQIGAAMGSTLGQVFKMHPGQRITLIAAGAGAGIAATFNTPIGGVLFAAELMLPEISVNTFLPVALATGTATFIGRLFFGSQPAFSVPKYLAPIPDEPSAALTLALYALLGVGIGVAAAAFIYGLHWMEDLFDRIRNNYLRHAIGMLLVGLSMYAFWRGAGHYYVEGVGYATIQAVLHWQITASGFLLLLFAGKLFATCSSLGSGSSGGIFSPSLFMGGTLGAAFATVVLRFFPHAPVTLPAFAMVGMGAMVGGGTGAAMTAVTMIFEMTRDYYIVLPMILAVATALAVRRWLIPESIYTMKLVRRGHPIPSALHANFFLVRNAGEVMQRQVAVLDASTPFSEFWETAMHQTTPGFAVVTQGHAIVGWLRVDPSLINAAGAIAARAPVGQLARRDFVIVGEKDEMFRVIRTMSQRRAAFAVVVDKTMRPDVRHVLGVITQVHVATAVSESIEIYPG